MAIKHPALVAVGGRHPPKIIGTAVTTAAEIVIIAPAKAREVRPNVSSIKTTRNSQKVSSRELRLTDRKRHSLKRR
jgi:hypothetical protein